MKYLLAALFLGLLSPSKAQLSEQKLVDSLEFTLSRLRLHLDESIEHQRKVDSSALVELEGTGIDSAKFWLLCRQIRPDIWDQKQQLKHMDSSYWVMKDELEYRKRRLHFKSMLDSMSLKFGRDSITLGSSDNLTYMGDSTNSFQWGKLYMVDSIKEKTKYDTTAILILISNKLSGATRMIRGYVIDETKPHSFTMRKEIVDKYYKPLKKEWELWDWHYETKDYRYNSNLHNFNAF